MLTTEDDRRDFIRGVLRVFAAGGLIGLGALAIGKGGAAPCQGRIGCGGCPEGMGCPLPRALAWREGGKGELP